MKQRYNILFFADFVKFFLINKRIWNGFRSVSFIVLVWTCAVHGVFEDMESSRILSVGGAAVAWNVGVESILVNPAGIFNPEMRQVQISYSKPFNIAELHRGWLAARFTQNHWSWAGGIHVTSAKGYQEHVLILATAHAVSEGLYLGISLRRAGLRISNYGVAGAWMVDMGILFKIIPQLWYGACLVNATESGISNNERAPCHFQTGLRFESEKHLLFTFDLYKDVRFPVDIRCGIFYAPTKSVGFSVGVGTEPLRMCGGISVALRRGRFDYACSRHSDLGLTHVYTTSFM